MKPVKLLTLFFLFPLFLTAQKTLTGVWSGQLTNDSVQTRNDQSFELALTEYRGKVYGYSYTTFIAEDKLCYIVKRVKGKIEDGVCEIEDDEIVSNNFYDKRDKGVKQTITFKMNPKDSVWYIDGTWKTNRTKNFYSISGSVSLKEEKQPEQSRIMEHLTDLKLQNTVTITEKPKEEKKAAPVTKQETAIVKNDPNPAETKKQLAEKQKPEKKETETFAKNDKTKQEPVKETVIPKVETSIAKNEKNTEKNKNSRKEEPNVLKKEALPVVPVVAVPAAEISKRKTETTETVFYKSDSLVLALYDNGEVDGDTVSVLLNGEVIMAKQGLKSTAIKKTIYVPAGTSDVLELVLYAENLGLYPPNTGLLIVYDGAERHLIRFSADYNKNATIILKRKKE